MSRSGEEQRARTRIVRAGEGRLLGGVCQGLPDFWGLGTNGLRCLFVLTALCGGIGIFVYLACWLVIPTADQTTEGDPVRGVVLLAWATGGLVALVLVAAAAALATVFGLGWIVFALAAIVVAVAFSPLRTRIPQMAALLTLAALTLPAAAVALSPIRLTLQSGTSVQRPQSYSALRNMVYRSGFGTLLVDLRHTPLVDAQGATLHISAGLRRTVVALPENQCVRVRVNYDIHTFPDRLAALLGGQQQTPLHDVVLFGRVFGGTTRSDPQGTAVSRATTAGPLLTIDFSSQGGGLFVRDYPDDVAPDQDADWPGFFVHVEPRPNLRGEPRKAQKEMLQAWHKRLLIERSSQYTINSLMGGPCVG